MLAKHQLKTEEAELEGENKQYLKELIQELDKLGKGTAEIPFRQLLFKNWNTIINFEKKTDG